MYRRVLALRVARGTHSNWLSIPVMLLVLCEDAAVEDAIISKETDCTIDGFIGEVIDVYQT